MNKLQEYTNHFGFVLDKSGSMQGYESKMVEVFDSQLERIKQRSIELNQETRISIYLFADTVSNLVFDMDVMRFKSIRGLYSPSGNTALIDATNKAIEDMRKVPELYSDHAFLLNVLTDGEENSSRVKILKTVLPDNWTLSCQVPNARGKFEAKKFGFEDGNINIWEVSSSGLEQGSKVTVAAIDNYMVLRSQGVKRSSNLYQPDITNLSTKAVTQNLNELTNYVVNSLKTTANSNYYEKMEIREFVELKTGKSYVSGNSYYQLIKPEIIQKSKKVVVRQKKSGKAYNGNSARSLIGLPDYDLKVSPGDHGQWDIFVQSTSFNRHVVPGQEILTVL